MSNDTNIYKKDLSQQQKDGLVALTNFIYNDVLYFSSIVIYTRPQGSYRLTRKTSNSSVLLFHSINKEIANQIEAIVIEKYEEIIAGTF